MLTLKTRIEDWPDTQRRTAFVYLPIDERIHLDVYVNYLHYYPASSLGSVVAINQTWSVEEDFKNYQPFKDHGTFNIDTFKYGLLKDGDGIWMEFDVPEEETSFRFVTNSHIYYCGETRKKHRSGNYTVMVFSTMSHTEKFNDILLPEAPTW